jgi:hypothetical protein
MASPLTDYIYKQPILFLSMVVALVLVVPKLSNMHKVGIFGSNAAGSIWMFAADFCSSDAEAEQAEMSPLSFAGCRFLEEQPCRNLC